MNKYDHAVTLLSDQRSVKTRLLLEFADVTTPANTYFWVSAPEPCYALDRGGTNRRWEPWPFSVSGLSSKLGDISGSCELRIANAANFLTPMILDKSLRARRPRLMVAWFEPNNWSQNALASVPLLSAAITSTGLANGIVTCRLGPARDPNFIAYPVRKLHPACQVGYGDVLCGPKGLLARCNHSPSATGGCADPGVIVGNTAGGKLVIGQYGGFFVGQAADL